MASQSITDDFTTSALRSRLYSVILRCSENTPLTLATTCGRLGNNVAMFTQDVGLLDAAIFELPDDRVRELIKLHYCRKVFSSTASPAVSMNENLSSVPSCRHRSSAI